MFDTPDVDEHYLNAIRRPGASSEIFGRRPVLARFVLLDGREEWRTGTAVRRSAAEVLVASRTGIIEYTWLPCEDVAER